MLFSPLQFGSMTVTNRLVRSGTSEGAASPDGMPSDDLRNLYVTLATGGVGLLVTGFAYVRSDGRSVIRQNAMHRDDLVAPWRAICQAVHAANPQCRLCMQLVHGGRQCKPESVAQTLAPSAVYDPRGGVLPREMTAADIEEVIDAFAAAARRAREAGFDAVQLHAAHGYLLAQFNSPHTNRRTDPWGGSEESRQRFLIEVFRAVRREVGDDFPVLMKMNCADFLPGGLTPEQSARLCATMAAEGLDGIELSGWMMEADPAHMPSRKVDPAPGEEGYYLEPARVIRQAVPATVPLGLCGGLRSAAAMERLLTEEGFDCVAACRPFLAEPDLPRRLRAGQPRAACNSCNECVQGPRDPHVRCFPAEENRLPPVE